MAPKDNKDFVCVGQFAGPHGLKGALVLKSFTEQPENIKTFRGLFLEGDFSALKVKFSNPSKGGFLVTLPGVSTPEEAVRFKGKKVFVPRADFKPEAPGEFYLADLEGLKVTSADGETLGRAERVYEFGAGPVLEIALKKPLKDFGKSLMVPLRGNAISKIDLEAGAVTVDLTGWLEEGGKK